jgi:glycosyltransferase involved in cell wall biosynthesis
MGVQFLQNTTASEDLLYWQPVASFYRNKDDLAMRLQHMPTPTIVHVHNEPDWMVLIAKAVFPNVPVVYDCHDLQSQRTGRASQDEMAAMAIADGYIFPSKGYLEGTIEFHKLPDHKPTAVVYSMCSANDMVDPEHLPPRVNGIVYAGGLVAPVEQLTYIGGFPDHRNYIKFCKAIYDLDIPLHLYGVKPQFMQEYLRTGSVCHPHVSPSALSRSLARYDWGYCGAPALDNNQWNRAMPNKLFEYLAAGLPILVYGADEVAEFVSKHEVGVVVDKLEDIPKVYDEWPKYKKRVLEKRELFHVDTQAPAIKGVYEKLLGAEQAKDASVH